jgi:hypothetical protein
VPVRSSGRMLQSEMSQDVMPCAFDASFPADHSVEAARVGPSIGKTSWVFRNADNLHYVKRLEGHGNLSRSGAISRPLPCLCMRPAAETPARVGHIAAEFERLANVLLRRGCGNPALITYPPIPTTSTRAFAATALTHRQTVTQRRRIPSDSSDIRSFGALKPSATEDSANSRRDRPSSHPPLGLSVADRPPVE